MISQYRGLAVLFLLAAALIFATSPAQAYEICGINQADKNETLQYQPQIEINVRNGPPYHDFYGFFDKASGTLLIISVNNPQQNTQEVPIEVKIETEYFYLTAYPDRDVPPEGPYATSAELEEGAGKCIKRLDPGESYPVAFNLTHSELVPEGSNRDYFIDSAEMMVSVKYNLNNSTSINKESISAKFRKPADRISYSSDDDDLISLPRVRVTQSDINILLGIIGTILSMIAIHISIFPDKRKIYQKIYNRVLPAGIKTILNSQIYHLRVSVSDQIQKFQVIVSPQEKEMKSNEKNKNSEKNT